MRSTYRKEEIGRLPTYNQIYDTYDLNKTLHRIEEDGIKRYWDTFVVDAFIGNFDMHKGNLGYLVNEQSHDIRLAPVYDCGSCLYPNLAEDGMIAVMKDQQKIDERLFKFPRAALNMNERPKGKEDKGGYYEMLSSGIDQECTNALLRVFPNINMGQVRDIIENTPFITDTRIRFYETMLEERYSKILQPAYNICLDRQKELNNTKVISRNPVVQDVCENMDKYYPDDRIHHYTKEQIIAEAIRLGLIDLYDVPRPERTMEHYGASLLCDCENISKIPYLENTEFTSQVYEGIGSVLRLQPDGSYKDTFSSGDIRQIKTLADDVEKLAEEENKSEYRYFANLLRESIDEISHKEIYNAKENTLVYDYQIDDAER